jgi:hypothetical protein
VRSRDGHVLRPERRRGSRKVEVRFGDRTLLASTMIGEGGLAAAGAGRILSSGSIPHPTNGLDLAPLPARAPQDEGYA